MVSDHAEAWSPDYRYIAFNLVQEAMLCIELGMIDL